MGRFGSFLNRNNQSVELKKSADEANIQKLLEKSEELRLKRQFDKALKCCDKALQINPNSPDVHFEIGVALSLLKPTEATASYSRALELDAKKWSTWYDQLNKSYRSECAPQTCYREALDKLLRSNYGLGDVSEKASNLISEALKIIENQVIIERGLSVVLGAGDSGPIMNAVEKFEAAHKLHPQNPLVHYAYASSLFLAMQYKSGKEVMEDCANVHPEFLLAGFALQSWNYAEWRSLFQLPSFGIETQILPDAIARTVKTQTLLPVRDGILPRAAFFLRDVNRNLDIDALQKADIKVATLRGGALNIADFFYQIVGVYARFYDDPSSPYTAESPQLPYYPPGHLARATFEYFCLQSDIDVVVIDNEDHILVKKRVPLSATTKDSNIVILHALHNSSGRVFNQLEILDAIRRFQSDFSPATVQFYA